jgi:hypothetical protein
MKLYLLYYLNNEWNRAHSASAPYRILLLTTTEACVPDIPNCPSFEFDLRGNNMSSRSSTAFVILYTDNTEAIAIQDCVQGPYLSFLAHTGRRWTVDRNLFWFTDDTPSHREHPTYRRPNPNAPLSAGSVTGRLLSMKRSGFEFL